MAPCCRQPARHAGAGLQVADVLRAALPAFAASRRLPAHHWRTLGALLRCHTPALGGHLYRCADCGQEHFVAHSCRNRHCPSCQKAQALDWLDKATASLLPVPYFHVVFTLPHLLNPLVSQNQRELYKLLFNSASATLLEFGQNKFKAQIGVTAVLHTWSQNLLDHYHLHCIVTGGGLSLNGQGWKSAGENYLFAVKALSKVFKARFRDGLKALQGGDKLAFHGTLAPLANQAGFDQWLLSACARPWVVYCKRPFAGPQAVLSYLSRYTHRVAISNGRIRHLDPGAGTVTFSYKDYADQSRRKKMELSLPEFLRRFCLHILPERFVKIRHYGLLSNRNRAAKIAAARAQFDCAWPPHEPLLPTPRQPSATPAPPLSCPHCGSSNLILIERRQRPRAPPQRPHPS